MHASAEERTLYPLAYECLPYGKDMYDKSLTDDQVAKELLQYVVTHDPRTDAEWELYDSAVTSVADHERRHMATEEELVLEPMRAMLSPDAALRLGQDWHVAKANAPLLPHPRGPTRALWSRLAHPLTGLVDRVMERLGGLRGNPLVSTEK